MGTITTYAHCAVRDGIAYEGTMQDIMYAVCDNNVTLIPQPNGGWTVRFIVTRYRMEQLSYTNEYTREEVIVDAARSIYKNLPDYGFRLYRDIGM